MDGEMPVAISEVLAKVRLWRLKTLALLYIFLNY
jgi:hypothetical protein